MGAPTPLIVGVSTPQYGHVIVDGSDGNRYHTDLSSFDPVHCFPRTQDAWKLVTSDSHGLSLVWTTRFEVHVDQVVALAYKVEPIRQTA
jgi:hypothetical protein